MLVVDYFVNPEQIESERTVMVVLDVRLDNFYAFKNFHMKLTYPKKIVGSSIKEEHLEGRPNFRYKKVNIIMGSNASGKTYFDKPYSAPTITAAVSQGWRYQSYWSQVILCLGAKM